MRSLWVALIPAGLVVTDGNSEPVAPRGAPHVLLIVADDLRCEIGCHASDVVRTPNLDRLARRGVSFDRAYTQATLCNPSRTSFLTGLRPDRTGVHDNVIDYREAMPDAVTLPQLLRAGGWTTHRIGKIFHGHLDEHEPDEWDEVSYPRSTEVGRGGEERNLTEGNVRWCAWRAAEGDDDDQRDGGIAREAVRFLERPHDTPFFLAVGFHSPHAPFVAPSPYFALYPLDSVRLLAGPPGPPLPPRALYRGYQEIFARFTDADRREFRRGYYAATTFLDAQVGRVLEALERSPFAHDTVVVFLSDHGHHLGERGWWNKATLLEVAARVPLVVYAPRTAAKGRPCSRIVELVDLVPTVAELCGLYPPPGLDGRSLAPLLDDPTGPGRTEARTQIGVPGAAGWSVRTDRWRLTEWTVGQEQFELYDHREDPGECRNVALDPEYADVLRELRGLLPEEAVPVER